MNNDFDWDDVEGKIKLICRRFESLRPWHEDLAQELRIHAYYVSTDYYNLYRKAIDFWRRLQTQQAPEIPYFDLDVLGEIARRDESYMEFDRMVKLITAELERPGYNKCDEESLQLSKKILTVILEDIDPRKNIEVQRTMTKSELNHYFNERLNLTWVSEEFDISYKKVANAMKTLEDIVRGLHSMGKISIPPEYFVGY